MQQPQHLARASLDRFSVTELGLPKAELSHFQGTLGQAGRRNWPGGSTPCGGSGPGQAGRVMGAQPYQHEFRSGMSLCGPDLFIVGVCSWRERATPAGTSRSRQLYRTVCHAGEGGVLVQISQLSHRGPGSSMTRCAMQVREVCWLMARCLGPSKQSSPSRPRQLYKQVCHAGEGGVLAGGQAQRLPHSSLPVRYTGAPPKRHPAKNHPTGELLRMS